jgi:hypothetical protein
MWQWRFWRETIERAVKSGAQAVALVLTGSEVFSLFEMDFLLLIGAYGTGAFYSVVTSIATVRIGASGSPSAID